MLREKAGKDDGLVECRKGKGRLSSKCEFIADLPSIGIIDVVLFPGGHFALYSVNFVCSVGCQKCIKTTFFGFLNTCCSFQSFIKSSTWICSRCCFFAARKWPLKLHCWVLCSEVFELFCSSTVKHLFNLVYKKLVIESSMLSAATTAWISFLLKHSN